MLKVLVDLTEEDKKAAVQSLIKHSSSSPNYFFMIVLSILMATFGFLLNSSSVIIGSMLIAPMLYPILSLAMGLIISDSRLIGRSFLTIVKSILWTVGIAFVAALLFGYNLDVEFSSELVSRMVPSVLYFGVSIVAGLAASFAMAKPAVNETLPGVAISVSLIPPLAAVAIGISKLNLSMVTGAATLFGFNVLGILLAAMVSFSLMQFLRERRIAEECVKKEDENLEILNDKAKFS